MRNDQLPKVRKFVVEAVNNENGFKMATNNLTFLEDKAEPYSVKMNSRTPFQFETKVLLFAHFD